MTIKELKEMPKEEIQELIEENANIYKCDSAVDFVHEYIVDVTWYEGIDVTIEYFDKFVPDGISKEFLWYMYNKHDLQELFKYVDIMEIYHDILANREILIDGNTYYDITDI